MILGRVVKVIDFSIATEMHNEPPGKCLLAKVPFRIRQPEFLGIMHGQPLKIILEDLYKPIGVLHKGLDAHRKALLGRLIL
jgi:hypothetical protein